MLARGNGCLMALKGGCCVSSRSCVLLCMACGLEHWLGRARLVWLMRPNDIFAMLVFVLVLVLVLVLV